MCCNSRGMLHNPVARLFNSFTTVVSKRKCFHASGGNTSSSALRADGFLKSTLRGRSGKLQLHCMTINANSAVRVEDACD